MSKSFQFIIALAIGLFIGAAAQAQDAVQLKVMTGNPVNTYSTMFKQLAQKCSAALPLVEITSSGSQENIDALLANQANAAFVQSDVLFLRGRTEDLGNVKTLVALHTEQVHIVARVNSGIKEGGKFGTSIGATEVVYTDLTSLAGRRVGAAGGSHATAQVIRLQSEVAFEVVQFAKDADVLAALAAGIIDAAVLVGGAPLGTVSKLDAGYKLLPILPPQMEKLKNVYRPGRLNYRNVGAAGVPTVVTDALFVTREYKGAKMVGALSTLRSCALANIDDMKETTGTHPAWQAVDTANKGKWPFYELPAKK